MARPLKWTKEKVKKLAKDLDQWRTRPDAIVLEQFCNENDIYPELISRLENKKEEDEQTYFHPEFRQALKRARAAGVAHAVEALLAGGASAGGMIFILKNISDMRDKKEIDLGNKDGESFKFKVTGEEAEAIEWGVRRMMGTGGKIESDVKNGTQKGRKTRRKSTGKSKSKARSSKK